MSELVHLEEELTALVDGELPELERVRVEEHLASCALCRGRRDALLAAVQQSRAGRAAFDVEPSAALRRKVLEAVRAERRGLWVSLSEWLWAPRLLAPLAAAAAGLALFFAVRAPVPQDPQELAELAVAERLDVLSDYELLSEAAAEEISPEDLAVVAHLHELGD